MRRIYYLLVTGAVMVMLTGCASPWRDVAIDENVDFSQLNRFQLVSRAEGRRAAPMLTFAINKKLIEKGYSRDDKGPEFLVSFYINTAEEHDSLTRQLRSQQFGGNTFFDRESRGGTVPMRHGRMNIPMTESYTMGSLVITVQLVKSQQYIWYGATSRRIFGDESDEKVKTIIGDVVNELLVKFPSR